MLAKSRNNPDIKPQVTFKDSTTDDFLTMEKEVSASLAIKKQVPKNVVSSIIMKNMLYGLRLNCKQK